MKMRDGVDRTLVTVSSESFGLMVHDNCRDKWEAIMKLKAGNKGKYKIVLCKILLQLVYLTHFLCKLHELLKGHGNGVVIELGFSALYRSDG